MPSYSKIIYSYVTDLTVQGANLYQLCQQQEDRSQAVQLVGQVHELEESIVALRYACVHQARLNGATWSQIADQLGVSRQAAEQRYGGDMPAVQGIDQTTT